MKKIGIIGSGDLGQQLMYHLSTDTTDVVVGYYDDFQVSEKIVNGVPILGKIEKIEEHFSKGIFDELIIGIGYKHLEFKKNIFQKFQGKIPFYTFIHSSAYVDKSTKIGEGSVVYPRCVIDKTVEIGNNVLLNLSCTISHDSKVGNHSFLSPSVVVAGFTQIGEECIIGINSTIIDNIIISPKTQIVGGSVVVKNIEKSGLYVGNPVRFIR